MRSAFCATPCTERAICSIDVDTSSTDDARLSVIAATSSIDAAISLIEEDVCSAETGEVVRVSGKTHDRAPPPLPCCRSFVYRCRECICVCAYGFDGTGNLRHRRR